MVNKNLPASGLHVVFAGGVTGGHLFPGLAVAQEILAAVPSARVTFTGPGGAFDCEHVARAGHDYVALDSPRSPRRMKECARFCFRMARGYQAALRFLRYSEATVAVGLGGFASMPLALAAARLNIPLLLLEQNAVLGRANRHLAGWASILCQSFSDYGGINRTAKKLPCPAVVTGTPVRPRTHSITRDAQRRPTLLVMGGSSGASLLNQAVPRAIVQLREALAGWNVVHQAGDSDCLATAQLYSAAGIQATVAPFFADLPDRMARADLAICRAGGSTLAELAVAGLPAILVPLASALDDHQRRNAIAFAAAGAAVVAEPILDPSTLAEHLVFQLGALVETPARRAQMQGALARLARPHAAQKVGQIVLRLAGDRNGVELPVGLSCPASPVCIDSLAA